MESFEFEVLLKVRLDAFNIDDAQEAVQEALEDLPGAVVTEIRVDHGRELG